MANPDLVQGALDDPARAWLSEALGQVRADVAQHLPVLLPQLPRRLGRDAFVGDDALFEPGDAKIDLAAWRACDAGAWLLFDAGQPTGAQLLDLYYHGDMEEKAMVLRVAAGLPITAATVTLLGEAQRTNTANHFEALVCDSNLLARAVDTEGFGLDEFNRTILKLAFVDLPLDRALDADTHANPELSRMLQDLASEREAAGRRVWRDTNYLIARAPTDGTIARLAGGLEHGDDGHRLAAAHGLAFVNHDALRAFARERIEREPRPEVREALTAAVN